MAEQQFTKADAEDAGWRVVHEADPDAGTANADGFRAEKYHSPPGYSGTFIEEWGETFDKLLERIEARERNLFHHGVQNTVTLPAEGLAADEVDASDEDTIRRVPDSHVTAARANDNLTVLSDPDDPDSEPVQKVVRGGQEIDPEALSEPATPNSATESDVLAGNDAAIQDATKTRDNADKPEDADGANAAVSASQADAQTQQAALDGASGQGDPGDSGNDPELTQPAPGEATDASDSEQQGQVPDSEAATNDAVSTNAPDDLATAGQPQPEETGPDTDAEAPAAAPNATPDATAAEKLGVADADRATGEGLPEHPTQA